MDGVGEAPAIGSEALEKDTASPVDATLSKKIELWKGRLLDISLKNRLVNFRESSSTLPLSIDSPALFYESLVEGGVQYGFSKSGVQQKLAPTPSNSNDKTEKLKKGRESQQTQPLPELQRLEKNVLKTLHNDVETHKRLYNIYLAANESITEQAVNTLYVAFGMLEYEDKECNATLRAPLVMVPAKIERKKSMPKNKHPFTLSFLDDDIYINPALRQKLLIQNGIDIDEEFDSLGEYFSKLREKVKAYGWGVADSEVWLGVFSFQKLSLYMDMIKNRERIMEHPVMRALAGDTAGLYDSAKAISGKQIDDVDPRETFFVLDADSSQQEAILAARNGLSFVLQGPPGTGKSQTIANIIAQLLADGKRVLFVSEKMAALEIVKKRLDSTGIGHYLLELHNANTTGKKWVLEQFDKALIENRLYNIDEKLMDQLVDSREVLHKYGEELMGEPQDQLPVYKILGRLAKLEHIEFAGADLGVILDFDEFKKNRALLEEIDLYERQLREYNMSLLKHVNNKGIGIFIDIKKASLKEALATALEALEYVKEDARQLSEVAGLNFTCVADLKDMDKKMELLLTIPKTSYSWGEHWFSLDGARLRGIVHDYSIKLNEYNAIGAYLSSKYRPSFFGYEKPLAPLYKRLAGIYSLSLVRFIDPRYHAIASEIKAFIADGHHPQYEELLNDVGKLLEYRKIEKELDGLRDEVCGAIKGSEVNASEIYSMLDWVENAKKTEGVCNKRLVGSLSNGVDVAPVAAKFKDDVGKFMDAYLKVTEYFEPDAVQRIFMPARWGMLGEKLEFIEKNADEISKWVEFKNTLGQLSPQVREIFEKSMKDEGRNYKVSELYEKVFLQTHLGRINLDFAKRSREYLDLIQSKFIQSDREHKYYSRNRIIEMIEAKKPKISLTSQSSEIGMLKKEIGKSRRHKPLRQLFADIRNLVFLLKPCFMMSPLSVARFIDPDVVQFDTVIFDEASQIMVEDSISSIVRGKQAIIVGDSKQLPPTTFFRVVDDEEIEEGVETASSILDEAASVLGTHTLRWHYRSKDESLINFSNKHFYNGELITFPNNRVDSFAIEFVHVSNGVYERGGSRQNRVEARKVVELVKRHFDTTPNKSLGVIAFSIAQQQAILEELDLFLQHNPSYIVYMNGDGLHGFFVKNLETVQGDERETIIISVGYGRDADGNLSLNFGPLNREGGIKRLNVAISRAIEKVVVVSSILPEEIEAARSSGEGIQMLKRYLEYARFGTGVYTSRREFNSDLQEAVYRRLRDAGLDAHPSVGNSPFNIDIAIRDPNDIGRYALAIELDSNVYKGSMNTRDRDRIRREVLESFGWKVHRIWSYDWFLNPAKEVEMIETILKRPDAVPLAESEERIKKRWNKVENELSFAIKEYEAADFRGVLVGEDFYKYDFYPLIKKVIKRESPIDIGLVMERVFGVFGVKDSAKSRARFNTVIEMHSPDHDITLDDGVFWMGERKFFFPVRKGGEDERPQNYITMPELRLAVLIVADNAISIAKEDMPKEVAALFSIKRASPKFRARVNLAVNELISEGYLNDGEKITVNKTAFLKKE